jgi:hypothetical protein
LVEGAYGENPKHPLFGLSGENEALVPEETLDFCALEAIMNETKPQQNLLSFKGEKILKYFPGNYTPQLIEDVILKLLAQWHRRQKVNDAMRSQASTKAGDGGLYV